MNGLLLAGLHPDIPYVYHPGTPMMCLIAIVIRVVHLFRPGAGMVADVMANPELYIRASVITANWIAATAVAFLGWVAFRRTKRILPAILFQAIPFAHTLSLEPLSRLIPEALMTAVVSLWLIWLLCQYTESENTTGGKRVSLVFGALYGLSVAVKLTFLPYVVIPLLVLRKWKDRFRFAWSSVVSFFLFAFPILFHHNYFVKWVKNIIIHTGKYGSGDKGVINVADFAGNIQLLIDNNRFLLIALSLLLVALVIFRVGHRPMSSLMQFRFRLGLAFLLTAGLEFIMAAKQFSYHYMLPAILLTVPAILLAGDLISARLKYRVTLAVPLTLIFLFGVAIKLAPQVREQLHHMQQVNNRRAEAVHRFMALRTEAPTIVVCSYYGCSAVEYALSFGLHESGKYGERLTASMKKIHPDTYLYFPWNETFYYGKREIKPDEIVAQGEFNLLVAGYTEELTGKVSSTLVPDPQGWKLEKVYTDSTVSEALFRLQILPAVQ
jgi:hypothetical protein